MTQNGEQKKKVFLCYAREDQPLMDDFYNRFKNYNEGDFEILYDRKPEHKNMHEVFKGFASECDVAILIVNARFINPDSYANLYEIPILIERKKVGQVVVVGIRFTDVPYLEKWNIKGEIFFFSLTNNDLPYTLEKKKGDKGYEKEFVNYEQIDDKDLNSFHSKLKVWILENLKKNSQLNNQNIQSNHNNPRPKDKTERLLNNLTGIYYNIEKYLSMNNEFWKENAPQYNDWNQSFGSIYFSRQVEKLAKVQEELESLSTNGAFFTNKINQYMPQIEESIVDCRLLLEVSDVDQPHLFAALSESEKYVKKVQKNLIAKSNQKGTEELKTINFPSLKHYLNQLIIKMNELKNGFDKICDS